jgi:hypothetical protein
MIGCPTRSARDGRQALHMPKFEGILSQEGMWAIRSWLDTKFTDTE